MIMAEELLNTAQFCLRVFIDKIHFDAFVNFVIRSSF